MKKLSGIFALALLVLGSGRIFGQDDTGLDLSTRCVGTPPSHANVNSVAQWMENPLDQKLLIGVSNFCAAATDCLDITVGAQHFKFFGAGQDNTGQYIPTNYPPVLARVVLRRDYPFSIMCPNSGPQGSPLFKVGDLDPNSYFMVNLTNSPTDPISTFLWTNFTAAGQFNLTNPAATYELQQTNLVVEMNRIITSMAFYTNGLFASYTNVDPIPSLITNLPTAQLNVEINRWLLSDALSIQANSAVDNSGTALIGFSIQPPPELRIKKNQPAPVYSVLLNGDSSSGGILNLLNSGTGYVSTNSGIIKVVKDKFGHFGIGDGCDDATKATGQASWLTMGPGCTEDTNRISLKWSVSLGRSFDGLAAGQLAIAESGLTRDTYTPFALYYNGSMTNLYAMETLFMTNAPTYITNSDNSITTNIFVPVQSQNLWAQVAIGTNATSIPGTNIVFCTTYTTNDDETITTNQIVTVDADPVWTQIVSPAPTNATAPLFTNIVVYTNCLVPVVLVQNLVPYVLTNSAGELYTNYDTPLRQVKAYQTFVDIVTPDTNQTILKFYHAADVGRKRDFTGLYTNFTADPFVVYTIQNPQPSTVSQLNIIETRNSVSTTQTLVKAANSTGVTYTLTLGSGAEQRVETRQVSFSGGAIPTDRTELNTIVYAGTPNSPAYQCLETYHCYPWGWELTQTSVSNSPAPLITTYDYYDYLDNPQDSYSMWGNGQVKQIVYPDGYWEKRIYENMGDNVWIEGLVLPGVLDYVVTPYLDATGSEGEATSPDGATPFNSIYTKYAISWGVGSVGQGRMSTKIDGLHNLSPIGNMWETGFFPNDNGWETGYNSEAPCNESVAWTPFCESDPANMYGDRETTYAASAPLGLSGKPYNVISYKGPGYPDKIYYYDFGFLSSASNTFILDATNHLYIGASLNQYPDCRETELSYGLTGADFYNTLEGHSYYGLTPFKTVRKTKVFHSGNLSLSEKYVYLGAGTTNSDGFLENPQWLSLFGLRYYTDSLGRTTNVIRIDRGSGSVRTIYSADYRGTANYDGPLLLSETDENGSIKTYTYDSLQRVAIATTKGFGAQPDLVTQYKYDANGNVLQQSTSAGGLTQVATQAYDGAGRVTNIVNIDGTSIGTVFSANNRVVTKNYPGGIYTIQEQYLDRRQKSLQGNGVVNQYFYYSRYPAPGGGCLGNNFAWPETIQYLGTMNSQRWKVSGQDLSGFNALSIWPIGGGSTNTGWSVKQYNAGYLWNLVNSPGSPCENYFYDQCGNVDADQLALSPGAGGVFGYGGNGEGDLTYNFQDTSRMKSILDSVPVQFGGAWYQATTNYTCLTDNSNVRTITSIHLEQLNGFDGNTKAHSIDYDAYFNETDTDTSLDRSQNKVTVTTRKLNTSALASTTIYQNGQAISASTLSVASPTLYYYDALGRTNGIQDPQGNLTLMTYDPNAGWLTSVTDPAHHTTSYTYYGVTEANAGKLKCQTDANGKKTYFAYTTQAQIYRTWGDVPYPAEYRYNEYGDLTNLITFRGGSGWTGSSWPGSPGTGDNTYWEYDDASGALLKKIDAQGRYVSYSYSTNTGQLLKRSWGRTVGGVPVTVTNSYNGFGDLTAQEYNDGTPNVYFNDYNRAGQPREIIDGSGTNELLYDNASRLVSSTFAGGLLAGITVSNHFNPYYGRDALKVINTTGTGWTLEDDYGYDNYGRLASVSSGAATANYGYAPNSDLLQNTTFNNNGNVVMTTTRKWNYGFQLASIANTADGAATPVTAHAYKYDNVNRRTQATLEDNSTWQYGYNDRNELTNANRQWYDTRPVAGQQFGYTYDNIGNRLTARFGGDTNGNNLRTISYTANSLNEYTGITTPLYSEIVGAALATNSVTVNASVADRHGEYFHREINTTNGSGAIWQNVTVNSGGVTSSGGIVLPQASQSLVYDADGNLTFDGVWTYQWDGENRLVSMWMTNVTGLSVNAQGLVTNRLRLDFTYDYLGRRIQKIISVWNSTTNGFQTSTANSFVYDGGNLIAILTPNSQLLSSFTWGNDLSGTMTKAGGVGGLLMASISGTNCFAGYDGNGNITAFVNATDKSLLARYEYNPYGQLIRETGLLASQIPFRYSTKFWDEESGLVYYGHRYYCPANGRWLGRDTAKDALMNLFLFCLNNSLKHIDPDGCSPIDVDGFLDLANDFKKLADTALSLGDEAKAIEYTQKYKNTLETLRALQAAEGAAGAAEGVAGAEGGFIAIECAGAIALPFAVFGGTFTLASLFFEHTEIGQKAVDFVSNALVDFYADP